MNNFKKRIYKQYPSDEGAVLEIIKKSQTPISSLGIMSLTNIAPYKICHILRKLKKRGLIQCVGSKEVRYWKAKESSDCSFEILKLKRPKRGLL